MTNISIFFCHFNVENITSYICFNSALHNGNQMIKPVANKPAQ